MIQLRVKPIVVSETIPDWKIKRTLKGANRLFRKTGVQFEWQPIEILYRNWSTCIGDTKREAFDILHKYGEAHNCLTLMFTKNIGGGHGGVANPAKGCAIIADGWRKVWTAAHELGHILGLDHINSETECYDTNIMSYCLYCRKYSWTGEQIATIQKEATIVRAKQISAGNF